MLAFLVVVLIATIASVKHFSEKRERAVARARALAEHEKRKYARDLGVEVLNESQYEVEVEIEGDLVVIKRVYLG
jgi:predicted xylose isomerase-like sugar epimerase